MKRRLWLFDAQFVSSFPAAILLVIASVVGDWSWSVRLLIWAVMLVVMSGLGMIYSIGRAYLASPSQVEKE